MNRKWTWWLAAWIACFGGLGGASAQRWDAPEPEPEPTRLWRSDKGSVVEAQFVRMEGAYVVLQKEDGSLIRIFPSALSAKDQTYIEERVGQGRADQARVAAARLRPEPRPGLVSELQSVENDPPNTYRVYLPKAYTRDRAWPVVFVFDPERDKTATMRRYAPGAEINGWIVVVAQSFDRSFRTSGVQGIPAATRLLQDIEKRFAVDAARLYAAGFDAGVSFVISWALSLEGKSLAGLFLYDGALPLAPPRKDVPPRVQSLDLRIPLGVLCGAGSYHRGHMLSLVSDSKSKASTIRYYPGKNCWPPDAMVMESMLRMNGFFLRDHGTSAMSSYAKEKKTFMAAYLQRAVELAATQPEAAYEGFKYLSESQLDPTLQVEVNRQLQRLSTNSAVTRHIAVSQELSTFINRHVAADYPLYGGSHQLGKVALREAARLADRFLDSPEAVLLQQFAEPARFEPFK